MIWLTAHLWAWAIPLWAFCFAAGLFVRFRSRLVLTWKLVRDNVPEQIESRGPRAIVKQLEGQAYRKAIAKKLVEEAKEVGAAQTRYDLIDELADLCEVMDAYRIANGIPMQDVNVARMRKFAKAGGLTKGYFLYAVYGVKARR